MLHFIKGLIFTIFSFLFSIIILLLQVEKDTHTSVCFSCSITDHAVGCSALGSDGSTVRMTEIQLVFPGDPEPELMARVSAGPDLRQRRWLRAQHRCLTGRLSVSTSADTCPSGLWARDQNIPVNYANGFTSTTDKFYQHWLCCGYQVTSITSFWLEFSELESQLI